MKKLTTKKVMTGVCALAFVLVASAGAATINRASAETLETFQMVDGAFIRMENPYGIRYSASIGKSEYETLQRDYAQVEYGFLICPTDLHTGKTLDFDYTDGLVPENAQAGQAEFGYVTVTPVLNEAAGQYQMNGALVGIHEDNLSRPFTGKAYVKTTDASGKVEYAYTEEVSRAIYTVATYAVNDPSAATKALLDTKKGDATQTPREYLNEVIEKVQSVYTDFAVSVTSSNAETADYGILNGGDTVEVTATVSKTEGGVTRTLPACPMVATAGNANVTLKQLSSTTYEVQGVDKDGYNLLATVGVGDNALSTEVFEEDVQSWETKIGIEHLGKQGSYPDPVFEEVTTGEFAGSYAWSGSEHFAFQTSITNTFEVGDRLSFDIYAQKGVLAYCGYGSVAEQYMPYSPAANSTASFAYRIMRADTGELIVGNIHENGNEGKWLRLEFTIREKVPNSQFVFWHLITAAFSFEDMYIRNMSLKKYSTATTVSLAEGVEIDEDKTYDFLTPINLGNVRIIDERGVAKTVKAKVLGGYTDENGVYYTGLGTQNITVTAEGYSEGLSYTIKGVTTGTILDGQDTLSNIKMGENFKLTYDPAYEGNDKVWIAGNNRKDAQNGLANSGAWHDPNDGFTFTDKVAKYIKAGTYLDVEIFVPSATDCTLTAYNNNNIYMIYSEFGTWWSFYEANGTKITGTGSTLAYSTACKGRWITLRINVNADWNNVTDSIAVINDQFYDYQGIRFGKISLTTDKATAPTINLAQ